MDRQEVFDDLRELRDQLVPLLKEVQHLLSWAEKDTRPLVVKPPKGPTVSERISAHLKTGPKTVRNLSDQLGVDIPVVRMSLARMKKKGLGVERGAGGFWRLV